jgi:hypothetical protein
VGCAVGESEIRADVPQELDLVSHGIRALTKYKPLAEIRLGQITSEEASEFAAHRLSEGMQVSTANNSLRVLRRILNLSVEWSVLSNAPRLKVLSGERHRERVITSEEEARYLAAAPEPLAFCAESQWHPAPADWSPLSRLAVWSREKTSPGRVVDKPEVIQIRTCDR